jgi:hypothetical protein
VSGRYAHVILVAEDERSANLLRRYVQRVLGIDSRRIRQSISPSAKGDAKQWVLQQYPIEVRTLRSGHARIGLVVHLDADVEPVSRRSHQLAATLEENGEAERTPGERIVHAIPRRHTETWLCTLTDIDVDEEMDCKRLGLPPKPDAAIKPAVEALYRATRPNAIEPTLPSLRTAILELRRLEQ